MTLPREDRAWIEAAAVSAGFDLAGLVPVLDEDDPRFAAWVASGAAGEMDWLTRTTPEGQLVRADLRRSLPWARSVLVCAVNYNTEAPRSLDPAPAGTGWIARYAWSGRGSADMAAADAQRLDLGRDPGKDAGKDPEIPTPGSDYHDELLPRLQTVAAQIRARFGPACQTRTYVDTGPILERGYAARAGVGWVGRNTCILNQQLGSWLLLGVLVTSLEVAPGLAPVPAADRCGTCTRCIDACPTDALHGSGLHGAPRLMDATRCIAYLTIEKKGSIDPELRPGMGRHVFGCDICQDVCPWNRRAPASASGMLQPRAELVNPALAWLASLDGPAFNRWFRGSPLERTRRRRILRNTAIAMGNSGDPDFRPQLSAWTQGDDPVLAEAAQWALDRLDQAQRTVCAPAEPSSR